MMARLYVQDMVLDPGGGIKNNKGSNCLIRVLIGVLNGGDTTDNILSG
jgi:hypothetical protein